MKPIFLIILTFISLISFAQKKKKLSLEEQVAIAKQQEKEANEKKQNPMILPGAALPAFTARTYTNQEFHDTDLTKDQPLIFVLFNPGCDHCIKAAKELFENISRIQETTVLFMCTKEFWSELYTFIDAAKIKMDVAKNFRVVADNSNIANALFAFNGTPQIMIYNKQKVLQKVMYEHVVMDSITLYMNK